MTFLPTCSSSRFQTDDDAAGPVPPVRAAYLASSMRFVSPSWRRILGAVLGAGLICVAAAGREQEPLGQTGRGQKPVSSGVGGGGGRSPFTEEYRRHVEGLLEELHVPGVAIAVVDGDDVWTEVSTWYGRRVFCLHSAGKDCWGIGRGR